MPELPEVETVLRGLRPRLQGARIVRLRVRERRLRWPVDSRIGQKTRGRKIIAMQRRGKYLLMQLDRGGLLAHLGMSGSFRLLDANAHHRIARHDHYDLITDNGALLRYHDPRRFGCLLWCAEHPLHHPRIQSLGIEPLDDEFDGDYLHAKSRARKVAIKTLLMNATIVVGIGNIYACESLHLARIHPLRLCCKLSRTRCATLTQAVQTTLTTAIAKGGTTIRDFSGADGMPGYFEQQLAVYGRNGEPCDRCGARIRQIVIAQRSTFYCPRCQRS